MNITQTRKNVNELLISYKLAKQNKREEKKKLIEAKQIIIDTEQAQQIAQTVAQTIQKKAHDQISNVVARCLQTVFEDDYGFRIEFERKRGRTEAKLLLLKGKNEIDDPLNGDSGGVVDVAAFALRVSCLVLNKPKLRQVLIIDEPFKNVHGERFRENVRSMMNELSKDFGIQMIMSTGIAEIITGKEIKL